ncbi:hypothetical protein AK812_SmicGene31368 [Symbiodinium microadriaticum]|uniref:Uncharacterized protein n=1 Tax=Symbiodinium microadriaticum TaxID=2951 RepID=A0A1Q9CWW5_SYMMI|nr:hypothetical protein AK812_SmicGene31368 [Symbiodinium microadriaticum]
MAMATVREDRDREERACASAGETRRKTFPPLHDAAMRVMTAVLQLRCEHCLDREFEGSAETGRKKQWPTLFLWGACGRTRHECHKSILLARDQSCAALPMEFEGHR